MRKKVPGKQVLLLYAVQETVSLLDEYIPELQFAQTLLEVALSGLLTQKVPGTQVAMVYSVQEIASLLVEYVPAGQFRQTLSEVTLAVVLVRKVPGKQVVCAWQVNDVPLLKVPEGQFPQILSASEVQTDPIP